MSQTDPTTVLTAALKLKDFTSAFYAEGLAMAYPTAFRPEERQVLTQIAKHEAAHVTTLRAALGGTAPAAPAVSSYDFTGGGGNGCGPFRGVFGAPAGTSPTGSAVAATPPNQLEFLKLAMILEDLGVRAHADALTALIGTPQLATLVRVRSTDARHSAAIRRLRNQYQDGSSYLDPMLVSYTWVTPWISSISGDYSGGVGFADVAYTGTAVYPGGLSQQDIINGTATSTVVDGKTVMTTVTAGVYGPLLRGIYNKPTASSPNEDNCYQSSSQAANVLIPAVENAWYDDDAAWDEPLAASAAAALVALLGSGDSMRSLSFALHFNRETGLMNLHDVSRSAFGFLRYGLIIAAAGSLGACGGIDRATGIPGGTGNAYVRYVNGAYQEVSVGPTTTTVVDNTNVGLTTVTKVKTTTYAPISVDLLLDSALNAPSAMGLAPAALSSGPAGQAPANLASGGYYAVSPGVHSFVARKNGLTPLGFSFFTTSGSGVTQEYLPKQYLTGGTYYTLGIAGIIPAPKADGSQTISSPTSIIFNLPSDDPFPPPATTVGGKRVMQARFQAYNFATWSSPSTVAAPMGVYLTPGSTPPTSLANLVTAGAVWSYNDLSNLRKYINVTPGTYYLSIWSSEQNSRQLVGKVVTFKSGEVRTFVIVNDMPSFAATTTERTVTWDEDGSLYYTLTTLSSPSPPTYKLIDVIDNQY